MHHWGMVIDLNTCIGCEYCLRACTAINDVNTDKTWNIVVPEKTTGGEPFYFSRPCLHCQNAPCVEVCPVKATYHREDGLVVMDYDRCIGCRYCEVACPYDARKFNWEERTDVNPYIPTWGIAEVERRPRGVVEKCTFCIHRIDDGLEQGLIPGEDPEATPACVNICPVNARTFGDLKDPNSKVSKLIANNPTVVLREELGTKPSVLLHSTEGRAVVMATATMEPKPVKLTPGLLAWFGLVGVLLLIGIVAAILVFWNGLVVTNMNDTVPWGLWITIDLSSIALGAGAFTLSAIVYIFGIKRFQPIVRLAVFVGFIGYTCALLTLVMDIGRPDRFWHPWVYWNIHSVLWEITWCITIYLTIMLLEFLPVIAEIALLRSLARGSVQVANTLHKAAPALAVLGLLISLLHQSSLGATYGIVKARPIWFKPSMPIMFILSAIAVGPALTMAVAFIMEWITGKRTIAHEILFTIARFSGIALLVYGYLKFWDTMAVLYYGRSAAVMEALTLLRAEHAVQFHFLGGGNLVRDHRSGNFLPGAAFQSPALVPGDGRFAGHYGDYRQPLERNRLRSDCADGLFTGYAIPQPGRNLFPQPAGMGYWPGDHRLCLADAHPGRIILAPVQNERGA